MMHSGARSNRQSLAFRPFPPRQPTRVRLSSRHSEDIFAKSGCRIK